MTAPRERLANKIHNLRNHRNGPADPSPEPPEVGTPELVERRDSLAEQFAELQWDLGGLTYEMAARDHFKLEVLVRQAARLQAVDAELAEAERLLRLDEAAAAGTCSACGAMHARGAVFCWQCGADLIERRPVRAEAAQ